MILLHIATSPHLMSLIDIVARGGGGGSGGSGGGGGGGSGGIAMVGYFPAYYTARYFNQKVSQTAGIVAGSIVGLAVSILLGFGAISFGILVFIGAVFGVYGGIKNHLERFLRASKIIKQQINVFAAQDPVWREEALLGRVQDVFIRFQRDWSNFDIASMQAYLTPMELQRNYLLLSALKQLGRRNEVADPGILEMFVTDAKDRPNNDDDNFTVCIKAWANDRLIDVSTGERLYEDSSEFVEFWNFDRDGDEWKLNSIRQATEDPALIERSLIAFAAAYDMAYSPDMGWLLLPQRGQLFGQGRFGTSDINNHIIGVWDGLLVQLYTYIAKPNTQRADNYLVGQIALPKSYGGIIVRRREGIWGDIRLTPRGYQKISTEWPDFNERYSVYATDMDKVTSFELLNPSVMADLYDHNLNISIEVVDNIVYFHTRVSQTSGSYKAMMEILVRAYQELKR